MASDEVEKECTSDNVVHSGGVSQAVGAGGEMPMEIGEGDYTEESKMMVFFTLQQHKPYWEAHYTDQLAEALCKEDKELTDLLSGLSIWYGVDACQTILDETLKVFEGIDLSTVSVLDCGCGNGHMSRLYRGAGMQRVTGCDYSAKAIDLCTYLDEALQEHGRALAGRQDETRNGGHGPDADTDAESACPDGVRYVVTDMLESDPPGLEEESFTLILDKGTLDTVATVTSPDPTQPRLNEVTFFNNVYDLLKPSGYFAEVTCSHTERELRMLMEEAGFDLVRDCSDALDDPDLRFFIFQKPADSDSD